MLQSESTNLLKVSATSWAASSGALVFAVIFIFPFVKVHLEPMVFGVFFKKSLPETLLCLDENKLSTALSVDPLGVAGLHSAEKVQNGLELLLVFGCCPVIEYKKSKLVLM